MSRYILLITLIHFSNYFELNAQSKADQSEINSDDYFHCQSSVIESSDNKFWVLHFATNMKSCNEGTSYIQTQEFVSRAEDGSSIFKKLSVLQISIPRQDLSLTIARCSSENFQNQTRVILFDPNKIDFEKEYFSNYIKAYAFNDTYQIVEEKSKLNCINEAYGL